jgi:GntR family transcriptional regulator / MocR family aminotransferase
LIKPGDRVLIENPHHTPIRALLQQFGAQIVPCDVDRNGICLEKLRQEKFRLVIVSPCHYPTGAILSAERRNILLQWAREHATIIIENDYGGEFCFLNKRHTPLTSLDVSGNTLFIGTFGFSIHPTVRTAFVVVPDKMIERLSTTFDLLKDVVVHPSHKALAAFIEEGHYARHVIRMRTIYDERRSFLIRAIGNEGSPDLRVAPDCHGIVILAHIDNTCSDVAIAAQVGLPSEALSMRYMGASGKRGFVLGFANCSSDVVARQGISQLARAVRISERTAEL